jgi:hypothetical protein
MSANVSQKRDKPLSIKQQSLIAELVSGATIKASAETVGIAEKTAHLWLKEPLFQREYEAAKQTSYHKKLDDAIESMNARHIQIALAGQKKAIEQINDLIEQKKFGAVACVQLLRLSVDLERMARGAAIQRLEVSGKDGAPIALNGIVSIYLPAKDPEV